MLLFPQPVGAQVITTVAGTSWLFPSSSLPASSAPLGQISGVAMDTQGNLYVADPENCLILKIAPKGTLSIVAGNGVQGHSGDNGPAVNASINPSDLAIDSKGNIYIQEQSYVRMVTPAGIISTIAGNGVFGYSGDGGAATSASMNAQSGMALDASGNLYFADTFNNRVRMISGGNITTVVGTGTAGSAGDGGKASAAQLSNPSGLAFDSFGNLYIADSLNKTIRQVSSNGTISTLAGPKQFTYPQNLAIDAKGANLYIADSGGNIIFQYSFANKTVSNYAGLGSPGSFMGDGGAANLARLNSPQGLVVDASGNLYIADSANYRLREVAAGSLKISTMAGNGTFRYAGDGGQAINAQLNSPTGMVFDSAGNLYFADTSNNRIRMVTPKGVISTVAGNGLPSYSGDNGKAVSAGLNNPTDVTLDSNGNLYIADAGNSLVRKVVLSTGVITTVAGGGQATNDGALAVNASLLNPVAVAADAKGNVYIAQQSFNKVSIVTTDGKIATFAGQVTGFPGYSGDAGPAVGAALNSPEGLAVDSAGNLFIADTGNGAIRQVNASGTISTIAGGPKNTSEADGPALSSEVLQPHAVAVDGKGNVYLAQFDGKIRVVSGGQIQTVAGGGAPTILGDGGPPLSAGINQPEGVGVDGSGSVYIADTANGRVRKVLGSAAPGVTTPPPPAVLPTWAISAGTLSFSQPVGGGMIPTQTVNLTPMANGSTPAVNGLNFSVGIDPSCSAWLSSNVTNGSMPAAVVFTVNPSGLAPNTYSCNVTIAAPSTANPSATIKVSLVVPTPPPQPALGSDTPALTFTAALNSGLLTQQIHVLNTGGGTLAFTATVTSSGGSWLSISSTGGSVLSNGPFAIVVTADPSALTPGTYTGSIMLAGAGSTLNIPVTLTISGPTAQMLVSEAAMTFTVVAGGGAPLPHNFGILNTGTGAMDWQATVSTFVNGTLQPGASWLSVSPSSGLVSRPYLDFSQVNVSVDPTQLTQAGTYYGRITIFSQAAVNQPQLITVTVNVLPVGLNPGPQMYPTGLIFTGIAGAKPGSQTFSVANLSNSAVDFLTGAIPNQTPPFSYLPLNATLAVTSPSTLQVYPDFSKLTPGSVTKGTITLEFMDNSPAQSVNLLFVVAPPGATLDERTGLPRASGSCSSQALQLVFRSPSTGFTAVVGQGTNIDVQVSDACGNLVGPSNSQNAKVNAFIGNSTVPMNHIGNGVWQGTWTPSAAGPAAVYVQALLSVNGGGVGGQTTALSGTVSTVQQNLPVSTPLAPLTSAVQHAASFSEGLPVAPGELITVWGANLASSPSSVSNNGPLPTSTNGLQVLLGVTPLPILYSGSIQMNVQVPYSVPLNTQYQLSVVNGTSLSVPQTVTIAAAQPGIFTKDESGSGQGTIIRPDGNYAQAGTPAKVGDTIVIYCTGLGVVTPAVKEGVPPDTAASTVYPATVSIGKISGITPLYAGVTPGYNGLYQVNVTIPHGVDTGDSVPVSITIAGQTSKIVTMSIH